MIQLRTIITVYPLVELPLVVDACCVSCQQIKSGQGGLEVEDYDAGRVRFLCRDCEEMCAESDRLAEEGLRVLEERERGGAA